MKRFLPTDRRLLTILLIVFVQMAGASMALPILPLFAKREFNMSPETITLLISVFFLAQFLAGPLIGRTSDRFGRLPVLIISQVGTVASFALIGLSPNIWLLFVARIVDGITGGNIVVAQAYVTDVTPPEKRTQALGYIFAAFGMGFIVGPAIGGVLSALYGTRLPFIFAAVAAFLTVILTWVVLDESLTEEQKAHNRAYEGRSFEARQVLANRPLMLILGISFIAQFGFGLLQSTFALFGEEVIFEGYSEADASLGIGLLLSIVGLGQFIVQTVGLPRLIDRFSDIQLIIIGTLLRAGGFFVYAIIMTPWLGPLGSVLFAAGTGIFLPPLQALSTRTVDDELRGGVLGLFQSSRSLAIIFSTAMAGVIFAANARMPFIIGTVLTLILLIPTGILSLTMKKDRLERAAAHSAAVGD